MTGCCATYESNRSIPVVIGTRPARRTWVVSWIIPIFKAHLHLLPVVAGCLQKDASLSR
jgi:hypothetical protein